MKTILLGLALMTVGQLAYSGTTASTPYTSSTAPDTLSRSLLAHQLTRLDEGRLPGEDLKTVLHRNYPTIIEQNFARRSTLDNQHAIDALQDSELHELAVVYQHEVAEQGMKGNLLPILATRLDAPRLSRLAKSFGYSAVYAAVLEATPLKAQGFAASSSIVYPTVSTIRLPAFVKGADGISGGLVSPMASGPNVEITLLQIYQAFRTGAYGIALSPSACICWETSVYASKQFGPAFAAG